MGVKTNRAALSSRRSQRSLAALDLGLRVRVAAVSEQRSIFSGVEKLSAQQLTSELCELVSSLRVRSFALRHELEQVASALMVNAEFGSWPLARRAALDLAGLLSSAGKRRLADAELCIRGSRCALRIAEQCGKEVR